MQHCQLMLDSLWTAASHLSDNDRQLLRMTCRDMRDLLKPGKLNKGCCADMPQLETIEGLCVRGDLERLKQVTSPSKINDNKALLSLVCLGGHLHILEWAFKGTDIRFLCSSMIKGGNPAVLQWGLRNESWEFEDISSFAIKVAVSDRLDMIHCLFDRLMQMDSIKTMHILLLLGYAIALYDTKVAHKWLADPFKFGKWQLNKP